MMIKERKSRDKQPDRIFNTIQWQSGEEVFDWWTNSVRRECEDENQMTIFDEMS
jgi:hypothetical protein